MGAMKMGRNGRQRTFCESEDEASLARHAVSSGTVLPLGPWNGEGPWRTEPEAVLLKMLQSTKVAVPTLTYTPPACEREQGHFLETASMGAMVHGMGWGGGARRRKQCCQRCCSP